MLRRTVLTALAAAAFVPMFAHAQLKYSEGRDYTVLANPIETADHPKVIEFFWFACPHCYALHKPLENWVENGKVENVEFEYVPAVFDSVQWQLPAQAYYTMQALGKEKELFNKYFDGLNVDRNRGLMAAVPEIKKFFAANGVSPEDFDKTWNSFEVKQKMHRAETLFANSKLEGVPAFVVNGKYIVQPQGDTQEAFDRLFDVINTLAKQPEPAAAK